MSTKKKENSALIETQHNGVTMILEKKSNGSKAPTPEMQARMEAGKVEIMKVVEGVPGACLLYTSPSPRDRTRSRMPASA